MFLSAVALFLIGGCKPSSSNGGTSYATYIGECTTFRCATDEVVSRQPDFEMTLIIPNMNIPKFDFEFEGIRFSEMEVALPITIQGVPFKVTIQESQGTLNYVFDTDLEPNFEPIIPLIGDAPNKTYAIKRVWGYVGKYITMYFEFESYGYRVMFTDDPEKITVDTTDYTGTCTTRNTATGEVSYEATDATITVVTESGAAPKAHITFNGIKFAEAMPALVITLPNLPTTTLDKDIIFNVENVVPTIGGVEYEGYKMSRVWGTAGANTQVDFTMATMPYSVQFVAK